jgi:hypothetical protein
MLELASEKSRVHLSGNHKVLHYISLLLARGVGCFFILVLELADGFALHGRVHFFCTDKRN